MKPFLVIAWYAGVFTLLAFLDLGTTMLADDLRKGRELNVLVADGEGIAPARFLILNSLLGAGFTLLFGVGLKNTKEWPNRPFREALTGDLAFQLLIWTLAILLSRIIVVVSNGAVIFGMPSIPTLLFSLLPAATPAPLSYALLVTLTVTACVPFALLLARKLLITHAQRNFSTFET